MSPSMRPPCWEGILVNRTYPRCIFYLGVSRSWRMESVDCLVPMRINHRISRYRMRALSRDRGPIWQKMCPYKSTILDFLQKLPFAFANRHFVSTIFWLTRARILCLLFLWYQHDARRGWWEEWYEAGQYPCAGTSPQGIMPPRWERGWLSCRQRQAHDPASQGNLLHPEICKSPV